MQHVSGQLFLKAARVLLCACACLIPLIVFPWTTDQYDFNKAFVTILFAGAFFFCAFVGMLLTKNVRVKTHPFFLLPFVFLLVLALSSAFSLAPHTSFLGEGGQAHVSFLFMGVLALFFLVASAFLEDPDTRKSLATALLSGSGIAGILTLLTLLGLSVGPFGNTVGTPTTFGVFLLVMALLGAGLMLSDTGKRERDVRDRLIFIATVCTALSLVFTLLALDSPFLWALSLGGSLVLFAFVFAEPQLALRPLRLFFPGALLCLSLVFLFAESPVRGVFPLEVGLNAKTSSLIVEKTLTRHPLLGSGPGTFAIDYGLFAPVSVNGSPFWDTRFSSAMGEALTMSATHGILGIFAFLAVPACLLFLLFRAFSEGRGAWRELIPPTLAWLTLGAAFMLFTWNVTLFMTATLLSAWIAALVTRRAQEISHTQSPRIALLSSFGTLLASVGVLVALLISLTRYGAELAFAKAVARDREGAQAADVIMGLNRAATRNRFSDVYYRNLAHALLLETSRIAQDPAEDPQILSGYLGGAVNAALMATTLGPNTVMNWEMLGVIYRESSSVVDAANDHAIDAYLQAIQLWPNNPKYHVGLARTYIVRADLLRPLVEGSDAGLRDEALRLQEEAIVAAEEELETAIALKGDYAPARYYVAFVHERRGNLTEAVESMELARALNAKDVGIALQLSLLYLRQGKHDLAIQELSRARDLDPTNDNILWYLSIAHEAQGNTDEAVSILEELVLRNPLNTSLQERLDALKKGQEPIMTDVPEPLEAPSHDTTVLPAP